MFLMTKEETLASRWNACSALKRIDKHQNTDKHYIYRQGKNAAVEWRKWIKWDVLLCFAKFLFGCCLIFHQIAI